MLCWVPHHKLISCHSPKPGEIKKCCLSQIKWIRNYLQALIGDSKTRSSQSCHKKKNSQNHFEKEKSWSHNIFQFQSYYKVIVIKTMRYWHKMDVHINGIRLSVQKEIYTFLVDWFSTGKLRQLNGETTVFNKWCWDNGYSHPKEWNWTLTSRHIWKLTPSGSKA